MHDHYPINWPTDKPAHSARDQRVKERNDEKEND